MYLFFIQIIASPPRSVRYQLRVSYLSVLSVHTAVCPMQLLT